MPRHIILIMLALLSGLLTTAIATPAAAEVTAQLSDGGNNFGTGDTHQLKAGVSNEGPTRQVDIYLALLLPNGTALFAVPDGHGGLTAVAANRNNPATWVPLLAAVTMANGLNTGLLPLFAHTFTGLEPGGVYTWALGIAVAGTLQFLAVTTQQFMFLPVPMRIQPLFAALWAGSWNNSTFSSDGPVSLEFQDTAPGQVGIVVTPGGGVFGLPSVSPFTLTATLALTGLDLFAGGSAGFGDVSGQIDVEGDFSGEVTDVPNESITRMDFSGQLDPQLTGLSMSYIVHFLSGGTAEGFMTAAPVE